LEDTQLLNILTDRDEASFCAIVDGDGEVTDFLRLPHIMKRRNGWNKEDASLKVSMKTGILLLVNKSKLNVSL
jgi:transcription elongation factor SPT6